MDAAAAKIPDDLGRFGRAGGLAGVAPSPEGGEGVHGAILEAGVAGAGAAVPFGAGPSPIQSRTAGTQERLQGRRTAGAAIVGRGTNSELCAGPAAAPVASVEPRQTGADARS